MNEPRVIIVRVAVFMAIVCLAASQAEAGGSRPPPSYAVPTTDGQHLFVMLSDTLLDEDEGNECMLPNGQQVKLRERFYSSGLYKIGSTLPIWTVNWYGEEWTVRLSQEGRYATRVNLYGGDGRFKPWAVKFYDQGEETKSYDVKELVDYPSLMEFTTWDYHFLWIDDIIYDGEVDDQSIVLETTTHETYQFDFATGEIISEFRMWRWLARGGVAMLVVVGLAVVWFVYRRWKTRAERITSEPVAEPMPFRFSLRSLFILTTVIAGLCGLAVVAAHVAVFVTSLAISVLLAVWAVRTRRYARKPGLLAKTRRLMLWLTVLASWCVTYLLSAGPVVGLATKCDVPHDVRMAIWQVGYPPMVWLFENTSLKQVQLIDDYFRYFSAWY